MAFRVGKGRVNDSKSKTGRLNNTRIYFCQGAQKMMENG